LEREKEKVRKRKRHRTRRKGREIYSFFSATLRALASFSLSFPFSVSCSLCCFADQPRYTYFRFILLRSLERSLSPSLSLSLVRPMHRASFLRGVRARTDVYFTTVERPREPTRPGTFFVYRRLARSPRSSRVAAGLAAYERIPPTDERGKRNAARSSAVYQRHFLLPSRVALASLLPDDIKNFAAHCNRRSDKSSPGPVELDLIKSVPDLGEARSRLFW